jgi:hypothetical protein
MVKEIRLRIVKAAIALLMLSGSLAARADADVYVYYWGVSPDPVNITEGEVVWWYDGDYYGPYYIVIEGTGIAFWTPGGVQFNAAGSYSYYDDMGDSGTVNVSPGTPNSPPVVTITSPTNNSVFTAPATFAFAADASDPNPGDLWDVEFWVGNVLVDDVYAAPYATTVTNLAAGSYTLKAIAWDYSFATATNSITITVVNPGPITLTASTLAGGNFRFNANGLVSGRSTVLLASTNLASASSWIPISTNVATGSTASFTNAVAAGQRYFRIVQLP